MLLFCFVLCLYLYVVAWKGGENMARTNLNVDGHVARDAGDLLQCDKLFELALDRRREKRGK